MIRVTLAGAAMLAGLLCVGPAAFKAQAQEDAHPKTADSSGWFAAPKPKPANETVPAESLAAFRPDSAKEETFRNAEAGPSPFARPAAPRDSADSVAALLRARQPAVSLYVGIAFLDMDAKDEFNKALEARRIRDSANVLQPYEPVHLAFPVGIQAVYPVGPHFDLVAKTHSYWYRQTAVLGAGRSTPSREESYALQANLGGAGLRYYIPPALLSVTGELGLYVQGVYYWLLGGGEIYSSTGSAQANFDPAGSGYEIQFGYRQTLAKPWSLTGSLNFMHQGFSSDDRWSDLLADAAPAGRVKWSANALMVSLSLWYHFGLEPEKRPAIAVPPGPETPAPPSLPGPPAPAPAKP